MKIIKIISVVILSLFFTLSILPYLVPLSNTNDLRTQPFNNSNYQSVNEIYLHFRLFEPQNRVPNGKILMVHGMGGSTFSFEKNAQVIADKGFIVVLVDLPGFGYSQRLEDFNHSQENRSDLLWNLIEQIDSGLSDQVKPLKWNLAGHSMGGGTVAAMAAAEPNKTKSLILIDAALYETNQNFFLIKYPPVVRWIQVALEKIFLSRDFIEDFLTSAYGRSPTVEEVSGYLEPLEILGTARSIKGLLETSKNMEFAKIENIKPRTLIIWGENDQWVPVDEAYRISDMLEFSKLMIVESAGHCPMETHSEIFNTFLITWLSDMN